MLDGIHDGVGVIVPAIRVVIEDDDGGRFPVRALFDLVDRVGDEFLLVERVGVAGVAVLIGRRLEEAHGREVAGLQGRPEVGHVVLVVGAAVIAGADGRDRTRANMLRIGRRGVVLERLVVRDVVGALDVDERRGGERAQPVEPSALVAVRSKPPSKKPQVMSLALSRSPMFLPAMSAVGYFGFEQTSPVGSRSLIIVQLPWPSGTTRPPS